MRALWAPWRLAYIEKPGARGGCFLCESPRRNDPGQRREALVLYSDEHAAVIMNRFPYANAHLMVAPRMHTADFARLPATGASALTGVLQRAVDVLERAYSPQGVNVGMNLGRVAGAGVADHLHWHVVPRWEGDTNFMPMLADTRVISQHIEESYDRLLPLFESPEP